MYGLIRTTLPGIALMFGLILWSPPIAAQDQEPEFENLQVLGHDISEQALDRVMLGNIQGLRPS